MPTVHVERTIKAPIGVVFDAYVDHAEWARVPGILSAVVVTPGRTEHNGLGAVREVKSAVAWFREEITVFERPTRMDYHILKSFPPLNHELGTVRFSETADGTHVDWTSKFEVAIPFAGRALGPLLAPVGKAAFSLVLLDLEKRVLQQA